jgi:membrane protease YdiL (CAAX protease family)
MSQDLIFEHLQLILIFGLLTALAHWYAKSKGWFSFSKEAHAEPSCQIKGLQVLCAFGIYLITSLLIAPLLTRAFLMRTGFSPLVVAGFLQLSSVVIILLLFTLFTLLQGKPLMERIWFGEQKKPHLLRDFFLGIKFWFIAFPLVVVIGQLSDLLIYALFRVESYEQVAVRFLKTTLDSPVLLVFALLIILAIAPIIEEWLFRGFLQGFFRDRFGKKTAIFLSSLCFSLFHLSGSQGWGNISLALSLFTFSFYLGFLYERQGTLLAPIGLHMAFNTVSSIRILLLPPS